MRRIVVHIDRVRLHGVDPADRERVVAELRDALARALAEPATAPRLEGMGHRASLRVSASPSQPLGHAAGEAIGRGLA